MTHRLLVLDCAPPRNLPEINVHLCECTRGVDQASADLIPEDTNAIRPSSTRVALHTRSPAVLDTCNVYDSDELRKAKIDGAVLVARAVARMIHSNEGRTGTSPDSNTTHTVDDHAGLLPPSTHKLEMRVLPSMTLRAFRLKLQKQLAALNRPLPSTQIHKDGIGQRKKPSTPSKLLTSDAGGDVPELSSSSKDHQSSLSSSYLSQTATAGHIRRPNASTTVVDTDTHPPNHPHHLQPRLHPQTQSLAQLQPQLRVWLVMGPQSADGVSELDYTGANDTRDLAWVGVEDGSDLVVWTGG